MSNTFRRILAVKLADLGDLLTVTPALQALRAAHPAAQIDLLVPPQSAGLLKGAPYLNEIIGFDKFPFDSLAGLLNIRGVIRTLSFLLKLRAARYDGLVLFHHFTTRWGTLKFAALSLATRSRARAGLDNGRGWFLTSRITDGGFGAMHEASYWLRVASLLNADAGAGWNPQMPVSERDRRLAAEMLSEVNAGPLVAVHPGAGAYSRARIWPIQGFASVARGLAESDGAKIVILGGPDEVEAAARLEKMLPGHGPINLAGRTSIHETAAVIERCDLFLGNDSGPMHIAAAVGTPVVAVFGPSNSQAWGPYTPPGQTRLHQVVSRDLPCMPCFYRSHSLGLRDGCGTRPCLTQLRPEPVLLACRKALDAAQRQSSSTPALSTQ